MRGILNLFIDAGEDEMIRPALSTLSNCHNKLQVFLLNLTFVKAVKSVLISVLGAHVLKPLYFLLPFFFFFFSGILLLLYTLLPTCLRLDTKS